MRFQAGSDLPHFKVANNQTQIRIHFYLKIIKGSSIYYNDFKCSAYIDELHAIAVPKTYHKTDLKMQDNFNLGIQKVYLIKALKSRKIEGAVSVLVPPRWN